MKPINRMPVRSLLAALLFLILATFVIFTPAPSYALSEDEQNNIRIYRDHGPSVVNIITTTMSYDFFLNPVPESGSGSGAILDIEGNIVTNYHVVQGAGLIEVTLHNGEKFEASIVGVDPGNDLAVIRIDAPQSMLKPIVLGASAGLAVGQKVLAIGNPFGLERTLTVGIISSLNRTMLAPNDRVMRGIIQTDAAINPGNSGGPLLDNDGLMIGLNTAIFSPVGANIGISFAIPVDTIAKVIKILIEKGYVARPWFGITGQNIDMNFAEVLGLPSPGVLVAEVYNGSPAMKAGLKWSTDYRRLGNVLVAVGGDFVFEMDGRPLTTMDELNEYMQGFEIGQTIKVRIIRDGAEITLDVFLEEVPR